VLVRAVALLVRRDVDVTLTLVGDGRRRRDVQESAEARELAERVRFVGGLPSGSAVMSALDEADVFVLPSRQEGLPRAMIEAMARGLPCIGSSIGGIVELLPSECLSPPGSPDALSRVIEQLVRDPARLTRSSERNLAVAARYASTILEPRRIEFYRFVRDATAAAARTAP
jgi:glycosyltransferase involved in cell wall biosynthesis